MNQDPLRRAFERWFEAAAMPCESDWFRRDPLDQDEYDLAFVGHAWDGYRAGFEECQRKKNQTELTKPQSASASVKPV